MINNSKTNATHTGKIGRSESYPYRGENKCYPFWDSVRIVAIKNYNNSQILNAVAEHSKRAA